MEKRHELIERYRIARRTLAEAVATHANARVGERTGEEILMHVAAWDRERTTLVPRIVAGEPAPAADEDEEEDTFNSTAVERLRSLSPAAQRAEYEASADAYAAMLLTLPDAAFAKGAPGEDCTLRLADHALEHAAALGDIGS